MSSKITVFLADDNLIVREGVRALLNREPDIEVVGVAADYDELLAGAEAAAPQVLVSDIRMPPTFQREGIEAAQELRKRHPGTGVVILSQYDDPEYAIALLSSGAAGYGYLLKDRLAEGDQLVQAVRAVATGGTALDPAIVNALVNPVRGRRRPRGRGRGAAPLRGRGQADQGHRRLPADDARGGGRLGGEAVPDPGPGGQRRHGQLVAAAADAAPGHRRPGGAGAEPVPPAAQRPGRGAAPPGPAPGRDQRGRGDGPDVGHPGLLGHRRAGRADPAGRPAQRAPGRDERRHPRHGRLRHAVRGRRGHGRVRRPRAPARPRRPLGGGRPRHARRPGPGQRPLGRGGTARLRARDRALHRPGRRRPPRLRGAARVHDRGRHREPGPAPPAVGRGRRDRPERGHDGRPVRRRSRPSPCLPSW